MSALLDQFIEEASDLLEAAGAALLVLERNPADARAINDLFRSVHTFKGTSALFDFPALTKLVHTGEDLLDAVREGSIPVTSPLVDLQLEMLDLLRSWIDAVRANGDIPSDAASSSRDLIARLAAAKAAGAAAEPLAARGPAAPSPVDCDWLDAVPLAERTAAYRTAVDEAVSVTAIEYAPDKDCYFRGEDPMTALASLPELVSLTIETVGPDPALADFDPYACRLRFRALSTAPRAEIEHLFRYVADQVRLIEIPAERLAAPGGTAARPIGPAAIPPSDLVDRIVEEQRVILALPADDAVALAGRIASVGRTLANIAAAHAAHDEVRALEAATERALETGDPQILIAAAAASFVPGRPTEPAPAGDSSSVPAAAVAVAAGDARPQVRMLKVDQAKVDRLMALIGELVVAKNALPFLARRAEQVHGSREMSREIGQRYSVIDRLAGEMQEAIMEVRLLPVSEVFARFPRLIRDIARKLDKQIELVLEGEETQADKNIIELLGDPLIHIVRNAADHGIESPQQRIAKGKPAHGTIRLRAMQEGDLVVIEISDDGRGVDTERVIAKALDRGLIDPEAAERMTPAEAANLIFHPGLSTADTVSDLSGRGVGMDVVQTSIRDAGGTVSVTSQPDVGTKVRLALPLSMAVVRVMTIETAGALYGVPIDLIAETVRIDATAIREIKQSEAFLLRDTIVPLVRLRRKLRLPARSEEREAVLVLRTPGGLVGMIVDRFDEHMDIILKPLEGILVGLHGFAGTALLGDGRVLMVLNVKELL
jgi:two-component system chemotaxis sensor kinase CheA